MDHCPLLATNLLASDLGLVDGDKTMLSVNDVRVAESAYIIGQ